TGAAIVYVGLDLISLLFLTDFRLGEWVRRVWASRKAKEIEETPEEAALQRRARELQRQKKQLEDEVARSGLGPDLKPVPAPTVRDLSVPENKSSRAKKTSGPEPVKEPAPADEGEVIPAHEVAAATTAEVLGRKSEALAKAVEPKPSEAKAEVAT